MVPNLGCGLLGACEPQVQTSTCMFLVERFSGPAEGKNCSCRGKSMSLVRLVSRSWEIASGSLVSVQPPFPHQILYFDV